MTGSKKIGLITDVSRLDFSPWTEWYMNKLLNFNKLHLSGLLLLAAFLKHSVDLYERFGVKTEAWPVLG